MLQALRNRRATKYHVGLSHLPPEGHVGPVGYSNADAAFELRPKDRFPPRNVEKYTWEEY